MKRQILFICCVFLLISSNSFAQIKTKTYYSTVPSEVMSRKSFDLPRLKIELPELFHQLKRQSEKQAMTDNQFAVSSKVKIDYLKSSVQVMEKGVKVYYLAMKADGALNINCQFSEFYLPEHASLSIYTNREITDSITYLANNPEQIWATRVYQGDELFLRLQVPETELEKVKLIISTVSAGYKPFGVDFGNSGSSAGCEINVNCSQGNGWDAEKNSVALIVANGEETCSGSLVMNTCGNNIPYFLTAGHCLDAGNVPNWVFQFQTWSTACGSNTGWIETVQFNGCQLRANNANTDFALLQLNTAPLPGSGIHYAGWSRETTGHTSTTVIHHPQGDLMKISGDNGAPVSMTDVVDGSRAVWQLDLDFGIVEGGSSGSPYFNEDHRVIGQHRRRPDAGILPVCDITVTRGGRFDQSWTGGGTNATRLSNWLDPAGSGAITTNTTNASQLFPNNLAISGPGEFCTTTSTAYSITNLPPGATVTWSTSYSVGQVTPDCPTCTSTTLTRVFDGFVNLTATINNICGLGSVVLTMNNISAGFPYFGVSPTGSDTAFPNSNYPFFFSMPPGYPGVSYFWRVPAGWNISYGQGTDYIYVHTGPLGSSGAVEIDVTACGVTQYKYKYVEIGYGGSWIPDVVTPGNGSPQTGIVNANDDTPIGTKKIFKEKYLKINPNPARDRALVTLVKNETVAATDDLSSIHDVQVIDKAGRTLKRFRFNNKQSSQYISLEGLSPDLYVVMVYDGKSWFSDKLVILK